MLRQPAVFLVCCTSAAHTSAFYWKPQIYAISTLQTNKNNFKIDGLKKKRQKEINSMGSAHAFFCRASPLPLSEDCGDTWHVRNTLIQVCGLRPQGFFRYWYQSMLSLPIFAPTTLCTFQCHSSA